MERTIFTLPFLLENSMRKDTHFLFYSDQISAQVLVLNSDEVAHLSQVLRFEVGDEIEVTNGEGTIYSCKIERMKRDSALCSILSTRQQTPITPQITLYVGIPDKERFDQICEMLPPLNTYKIVPVIMKNCTKSWWSMKWHKTLERANRKGIASMKQSRNPFQTIIEKPILFEEALAEITTPLIFADAGGQKLSEIFAEELPAELAIFIGPPAGYSEEETLTLNTKGTVLDLGPYRMRTELAAVVAVGLLGQR